MFNQESRIIALVTASVGISFITFLGIVIYHAYSRIKKLCCNHRAEYEDIDNVTIVRQVTRSVVAVNNEIRDSDGFREPLLESDLDTYEGVNSTLCDWKRAVLEMCMHVYII